MAEEKTKIICKECGEEVSIIFDLIKISIHTLAIDLSIEAMTICMGCFRDLLDSRIFTE